MGYRSRKGYRIAVSVWSTIFHNRFYLGETWLRKGDVPTKGNHQPLIDEATFARVQQVLKEHDNYKQRIQRHKYLLQGLLYSKDSSTPCFVETHPRKKISYYRTKGKVNGSQIYYNTRDIDEQLFAVTKAITLNEDAGVQLKEQLDKWFAAENNGSGELEQAKQRLAKLERMEKNLQRLVIEEDISFEDFKEHRLCIEAERANLKNLVESINSHQSLVRADFEIALQLAGSVWFRLMAFWR